MTVEQLFTLFHGLAATVAAACLVVLAVRGRRKCRKPKGSLLLVMACVLFPLPYLLPLWAEVAKLPARLSRAGRPLPAVGEVQSALWSWGVDLLYLLRHAPVLAWIEGVFAVMVLVAFERLSRAWRDQ